MMYVDTANVIAKLIAQSILIRKTDRMLMKASNNNWNTTTSLPVVSTRLETPLMTNIVM